MRIYEVKKARKEWPCSKCGKTIEKGQPYRWWQHMHAPVTARCMGCGYPRPSELASSDKLAAVLSAQEAVEDAMADVSNAADKDSFDSALEALKSAVSEAAEQIREAGEGYGESADNMEQAFPNGSSVIDDIREKADTCGTWADNLESAASELESVEVEDCDTCQGDGHVDCPTCNGEGSDPDNPDEDCPQCNGECQVECEECDGDGYNLQASIDSVQSIIDDAMSETIG